LFGSAGTTGFGGFGGFGGLAGGTTSFGPGGFGGFAAAAKGGPPALFKRDAAQYYAVEYKPWRNYGPLFDRNSCSRAQPGVCCRMSLMSSYIHIYQSAAAGCGCKSAALSRCRFNAVVKVEFVLFPTLTHRNAARILPQLGFAVAMGTLGTATVCCLQPATHAHTLSGTLAGVISLSGCASRILHSRCCARFACRWQQWRQPVWKLHCTTARQHVWILWCSWGQQSQGCGGGRRRW